MKPLHQYITRILLCAIFAGLFSANELNAQLQNYEFGLTTRGKKNVTNSTDWHMQQRIYGGTTRCHFSLLDMLINRDGDNRFRFGEYLGAGFGTGYVKEQINPNGEIGGPDTRVLKSMWMTIDLQLGLQAAYNISDDLTVGIHAFKELQFGFVVMTDYAENIYAYNVIGGSARYAGFYLEYSSGLPWNLSDADDYDDRLSRFHFRFFTNKKEGKNIGLRVEIGKREWTGRTDRLSSVEFCFGRMF